MPAEDQGLEFDQELEEDEAITRPPPKPANRAKPAGARPSAAKPAGAGPRKNPVKGRLGRGRGRGKGKGAPGRERPKFTVQVVGLDRSFQAEEGTDLRTACKDNHVNVFWGPWAQAFNCRGVASCALCKIQVVEGADNLSPRTKKEQKRLRNKPDDWRLACHANLQGDVRIDPFPRIPIDEQVGDEAIRRALMTEEERESLRQEAKAARQAEREKKKGAPGEAKTKQGLVARLKAKAGEKKGKGDKPDKAKGKGKGKPAKDKKGKDKAKSGDQPAAEPDAKKTKDKNDKPAKKSFGLKGKK